MLVLELDNECKIIKSKTKRLKKYVLGCRLGCRDRRRTFSVYGNLAQNSERVTGVIFRNEFRCTVSEV